MRVCVCMRALCCAVLCVAPRVRSALLCVRSSIECVCPFAELFPFFLTLRVINFCFDKKDIHRAHKREAPYQLFTTHPFLPPFTNA